MRSSLLRRIGIVALALSTATWALHAPAQAEPTTGAITGQLTDSSGAPVPYAYVSADGPDYLSATTDEDGFYEIADLAAGDYRVSFDAPGAPWQYAYQKTNWETADVITVTAGETVTVNDSLLPTGTLTGRFTTMDGTPVHAWVSANPDAEGSYASDVTDADGYFSLTVLAGTYRVEFEADGLRQYAYGATGYDDAELFTVAAGETVTVNDTKLPTATIAGRFTTADGKPVTASVSAEADSGGSHRSGGTDEDGYFSLDVLPGSYRIRFDAGSAWQYAYGTTNFFDAEVFEAVAGETVTVNDVQLPTGSLAGHFTDIEGNPLTGVRVNVSGVGHDGYDNATTDADGYWRVDGLLTGDYTISFQSYDHGIYQFAYGKTDQTNADVVTVTEGTVTTVDDAQLPTGSIRVTAIDAATGEVIQAFWAFAGLSYGSTENGELLLENIPAGEQWVEVSADGYLAQPGAGRVTVVADQVADLTVTLTPSAHVEATIVDAATGDPVAGVCVMAVPVRVGSLVGCGDTSDDQGKITVSRLRAGTYQLFAYPSWADGYGAQWVGHTGGTGNRLLAKRIRLDAGETAGVTIAMDHAGTVTGRVTNPDGTPAPKWSRVGIHTELGLSGEEVGSVDVGEDGRYTIDFLGPYRWPLHFDVRGQAEQWSGGVPSRLLAKKVRVTAGATTTYDHRLRTGTTVNVTVSGVDEDGFVIAYDAVTGDIVAKEWFYPGKPGPVVTHVKGPHVIKFQIYLSEATRWYGGDSFRSAKPMFIPSRGSKDITLTFE